MKYQLAWIYSPGKLLAVSSRLFARFLTLCMSCFTVGTIEVQLVSKGI